MKLIPGNLYQVINDTKFNYFNGRISNKEIRQQTTKNNSFYLNNEIVLFVQKISEQNCWDDVYDIWIFMHKGEYVECAPTYMPEKMFTDLGVEKCN